jgi:hypothetical protein
MIDMAPLLIDVALEGATASVGEISTVPLIPMGPFVGDWLDFQFFDAALAPFMGFAALFVGLVALMIGGGLAIYSRSMVLPAVVAILLLGAFANYIPGLVARSGFLFIVGVAAAVLLAAILVIR